MALTLEQVTAIWGSIRDMAKPYWRVDGFQWRRDKNGYSRPEFWPGYNASYAEHERLEPHIVHGEFPEELFKSRAPNASDKELQYMRDNFKQVTLPVYSDYENTILRAIADNNFTIIYGDGKTAMDDERISEFQEYVNRGITEFGSVINYVRSVLVRLKAIDPMGLIVILPPSLPTITGEDGAESIDPDALVNPVPHYVECEDVWGFAYDQWYLWKSEEKSTVSRGSRTEQSGLIFYLADDQWLWKIVQVGRSEDFTFEIVQWWQHGTGQPPCIHLQGVPIIDDGALRWQSHYLPAIEPLDQVLLDTSYLMASKAKVAFPHMVVLDDPCTYMDSKTGQQCYNGFIEWTDNGNVHKMTCPSCNGTGAKPRIGPMGVVLVRGQEGVQGSVPNVSDALTFISPPVDTLNFLRSEIEYNLRQGRSILHLHSEAPITGGQSATATQIGVDVRAAQAFVKPIADQTFFITEFILDCIGAQRYGDQYPGITITRPSSYDVRTQSDLLAEYTTATEQMPPSVTESILWQYIKARYGHEPEALRAYEVLAAADAIFASTPQAIQQMFAQGIIESWKITLHQQGLSIYDELMREGALTDDIATDAAAMQQRARARTPVPVTLANRLTEVLNR